MRIVFFPPADQAAKAASATAPLFAVFLLFAACTPKETELQPVLPPAPVLSRAVIGYGVINVSYTRVSAEPDGASLSLGWFRRGAVVEVLERRSVASGGRAESWIFVASPLKSGSAPGAFFTPDDPAPGRPAQGQDDMSFRGWLREGLVQIYANRAQAETASGGMGL
jgi:hypothetical protein